MLFVSIHSPSHRPSFKSLDNFFSDLNYLLFTIQLCQNILVIGDLNIDISSSRNDINKDKYLNLPMSHDLLTNIIYDPN